WVTPALVDEALAGCGRRGRRPGALSARFMVNFVLALALFHQDSYDDVAENLVNALPGMGEDIPNRGSFTRARQRLGPRPLEAVSSRVGGLNGGERDLAIAMAGAAAGMLVIMDRGFPGVELWKAYTQAGAHLLLRARSSVARRPVQVLADGTYLARMNLAGQKGSHPGGVVVRVIEYRVDGGEVVRLLTDLMDPVAFPAGELAALYH